MDKELQDVFTDLERAAPVVNAFAASGAQKRVLEALLPLIFGRGVPSASELHADAEDPRPKDGKQQRPPKRQKPPARHQTDGRRAGPVVLRDLDLAPRDGRSFTNVVEEKKPSTIRDRCMVSVYYLAAERGLQNLTVDHVNTCFRDQKWERPTNLANALQVVASRDMLLDTSSMQDIRLTPKGEDYVEHKLPLLEGRARGTKRGGRDSE